MEILESITEQIAVTRLPLVGVTVAAVPCPDTPIILTLHWHGFVKDARADVEEHEAGPLTPVPSSSLQVNERWSAFVDLEMATMEAGWELGAWDVVCNERPACLRPGASAREALECLQAFGSCPTAYEGNELVLSDAPDAEELIALAGQSGYLCWQFRPVHAGLWANVHRDATLNADGTRTPRCPLRPSRRNGDGPRRTVYRFGESRDRSS